MSTAKIILLIFSLPIGLGLLHYYHPPIGLGLLHPPTHEQKVEFLLLTLIWTNMLVKRR